MKDLLESLDDFYGVDITSYSTDQLYLIENRLRQQADRVSACIREKENPGAYLANPHANRPNI